MALMPVKRAIVWGDFVPHLPIPDAAGMTATPSPDGVALTVVFSGLEIGAGEPGQPKAATLVLAGVLPLTLPPSMNWSGTLGMVRGAFNATAGARGNLDISIGGGVYSQAFTSPVAGDAASMDFTVSVFSPEGTVTVSRDGGPPVVETVPLTVSVLLSVAAPGDKAAALLTVNSIDLSLWVY